jgi:hypothetical protein
MKVTIEFDSVSDRDVLDEVLSVLPNGFKYQPPEHINVVAPPPAEPFGAHGFGDHGKPPAPPVEPMAVPSPEAVFVQPETPAEPPPYVPVPTPPGVERDADGLPWDGRIHSSSKALLVDGKWRQRRNTDPAVVAAVTAELRAALGAPAAPTVTLESLTPQPSPMELSAARLSPPMPPPPALAIVPPPPPVETAMSFPEFMKAITAARIPPGTVLDACKAVGMPSIPALNQRPDLIPTVAAALGVA